MKILVCVKQAVSGELNPFDAAAYEAALRLRTPEDTVELVSMAPAKSEELLLSLTRLGASTAYLLCDRAFAGADTLATAYTLSLAVKRLQPDLILCGRQTVDGDTAQTGPSLSVAAGYALTTNAMSLERVGDEITATTRGGDSAPLAYPALVTVERFCSLRFPSIRSKVGQVVTWNAADLEADVSRCGLTGSPTKVVKTFENQEGRRHCTFVEAAELPRLIAEGRAKGRAKLTNAAAGEKKLPLVWCVGEKPRDMALSVAEEVRIIPPADAATIAAQIKAEAPAAVLWPGDDYGRATAPQAAAMLQTGLCADCTALETDGERLFMYRPAFSGNIIAKIACVTDPQMATVRTVEDSDADTVVAVGLGGVHALPAIAAFAEENGAALAASRAVVDAEVMPYSAQIGLTGRSVSPAVYVAVGVSGAVHHVEGMKRSGTVIAINKDKSAPIFDYADYGIVADVQNVF